jgi:hypothetical protein
MRTSYEPAETYEPWKVTRPRKTGSDGRVVTVRHHELLRTSQYLMVSNEMDLLMLRSCCYEQIGDSCAFLSFIHDCDQC